jgi:hypothetical protein
MIRILIMANDSLLADSLASTLEGETDLDVVRLTQRELRKGDQYSVVIIIDEGETENDSIKTADLFWNQNTFLVIMISLKSRNIYVYEHYQLVNPEMERVIQIVRDFSRMNLKKKFEEELFQVYANPLSPRFNPSYYIEPNKVPNSFERTVHILVRE